MLTCCCALAGTEACKKCAIYIAHFRNQEIRETYLTPIPTQKETSYISKIIEPKRGKWIDVSERGSWEIKNACDQCGKVVFQSDFNYCPNCGARMESDTE